MLLLTIFITGLTLPGVSYQGDRIFYTDARSMSLGGVSLVLESATNPASMTLFTERAIRISGLISVQSEDRGLRVYDSFGNNIGIATVASNTGTYLNPGNCFAVFPFQMLRLGLQYAPVWDYNYTYYEEHRDDFYQIVRIDELTYRGYVHAITPVIAFNYRFFSIGAGNSFLLGTRVMERTVIIPQVADTVSSEETNLKGNSIKIGASFIPAMNFRMSYSYQHKYQLDDAGYEYPEVHSFAIMYQPPGRIPTRFLAQVEAEMWGDIFSEDIFIYKIGIEHMILQKYNLRYGFCVFPDYQQDVIWTTNLTLGFGFQTGLYAFDVGYCYGKRDYLASDYPHLELSENYKLDETTHHFMISIGMQF